MAFRTMRIDVSRSPEDVLPSRDRGRRAGDGVASRVPARRRVGNACPAEGSAGGSRGDPGASPAPRSPSTSRSPGRARPGGPSPEVLRAREGSDCFPGIGAPTAVRRRGRASRPAARDRSRSAERRIQVATSRSSSTSSGPARPWPKSRRIRAGREPSSGKRSRSVGSKAAVPDSVRAPRVLHAEPGLLLLEPFEWVPRRRPWELDEPVARALGQLFRSGKREAEAGWTGPAHGDAAPWNLLRTPPGWALVDWESAGEAPAFHDVCHYIVQSHALLGWPSASGVIEGFCRGRGWVGRAVSAYAEAADIPHGSAPEALAGYLERAIRDVTWRTSAERKGAQRRRRLLHRLGGG